jgi:hypothetical protein
LVLFYYELIILGPYSRGLKFLWEKDFGLILKKKLGLKLKLQIKLKIILGLIKKNFEALFKKKLGPY